MYDNSIHRLHTLNIDDVWSSFIYSVSTAGMVWILRGCNTTTSSSKTGNPCGKAGHHFIYKSVSFDVKVDLSFWLRVITDSQVRTATTILIFVELYTYIWKIWTNTTPSFVNEHCGQLDRRIYPNGNMSYWIYTTALCCSVGGGIRALCHRSLGDFFTWEVSLQKSQRLITTGPYSYVRHPSYLGSLFAYLGVCLFVIVAPGTVFQECVTPNHPIIAFLLKLYYGAFSIFIIRLLFSRIPLEDRILRERFGMEWEQWAKQTPYRVFPFIF